MKVKELERKLQNESQVHDLQLLTADEDISHMDTISFYCTHGGINGEIEFLDNETRVLNLELFESLGMWRFDSAKRLVEAIEKVRI